MTLDKIVLTRMGGGTGGSPGTGGAGSGGVLGTGGGTGSGGATGTGGAGSGGVPGTGGMTGNGGAIGTGGAGSGGVTGSGGTIGTGGRTGTGGTTTLTFQGEKLTAATSGAGSTVVSDANASGGGYIQLNTPIVVGNWLELTVPSLAAGTYAIALYYKSNTNRAVIQASLDGVAQGSCDEYAASAAYQVKCALGTKALAAGSHKFRFTVTGKNAASSGYTLTVDAIVLTR
jgi:hypothetical protein